MEESDALDRAERMRAAIAEEEAEERERYEERREVMRALEEAGRAAGRGRGGGVDADEVVRAIKERRRRAREAGEKVAEAKRTRMPARRKAPGAGAAADEPYTAHTPNSPQYEGPYVPWPYSAPWDPPHLLASTVPPGPMALDEECYVDVDSWAKLVKNESRDGGGRYRGGGYILADYWRREMAMALDSLGVEMAT